MWNEPSVALFELQGDCSASLQKTIRDIFNLPITKHVIAQVFDGLPVRDDYFGPPDAISCEIHPEIATRAEPTSEAKAFAARFCSALEVQRVTITAKTAERLQQATNQGSRSSLSTALRLLEASSSVFHDIISKIYNEFHPGSYNLAPEQIVLQWKITHHSYTYGANYKNEFGSMAGYWAETLIFGGPVMFARGAGGQRCDAAFIHPRTGSLAQLTDGQVLQYMTISEGRAQGNASLASLLPFKIGPNARRLTIQEAMAEEIYRERGQIDFQWGDGTKYGFSRVNRCGEHSMNRWNQES